VGAAEFWVERLNARGIEAKKISRFGADRVAFAHPCGIPHELVESDSDTRESITNDKQGIGKAHGIKGIYGGLVACFDRTAMEDFMTIALPLTKEADSEEGTVYRVPDANGVIQRVEVITDRDSPAGTWTLSGGTIHHLALNTGDEENQLKLRAHIEGLGFTDISEQKDRNYFKSCYVRSPGGALFELAWTTPQGWARDEEPGSIGKTLVFPPWFKDREAELREGLEQAEFV
jgi:glyoxalase family protein